MPCHLLRAATACNDAACYAVRLDLALPVPEPGTWGMPLAGGLLLGLRRRRRRPIEMVRPPVWIIAAGVSG